MPFWALVLKSSGEKSISGYVSGNIYIYILYIYIYIYIYIYQISIGNDDEPHRQFKIERRQLGVIVMLARLFNTVNDQLSPLSAYLKTKAFGRVLVRTRCLIGRGSLFTHFMLLVSFDTP